MDAITNYIKVNQQKFLDELITLLKIPSISAISQNKKDCIACAEQIELYLKQAGAVKTNIFKTPGNPVVYGETIIDNNKPTVLVYGHYDVQPIDPINLWHTNPFEPVIKNNKIFARGASDDKGQMFMHIKALEILNQTKSLPVNIKFLIEGEEEIGCINLESFIKQNKALLKSDVVLISDSAMISLKKPSIDISLRGLVYIELELTGPNRDLHSGVYGGAVANPILILSKMLASLHDKNNKITIPNFYKNVTPLSKKEKNDLKKVPFNLNAYKKEVGIKKEWGEKNYSTLERTGTRPTLEINGIWGGYIDEGAKTVLPSKAYAKISCRLVNNQTTSEIMNLLTTYLKQITPPEVSIKINPLQGGDPYLTELNSSELIAASGAIKKVLGTTPCFMRGGGSIPVVNTLKKYLNINSILLGMGLDDDNLHSPNEKFNLDHFYKGIEIICNFYHIYAQMKASKK